MDSIKILRSPWEREFIGLLKSARKHIQLASPFIKENTAALIVSNAHPNTRIDYLNSFKLASFHRGASDINALRLLSRHNVDIRNHHRLHAKIFIFDGKKTVVTSSNLTPGGLIHNYEYGLLIKDKNLSARIAQDYRKVFNNRELTGGITPDIIETTANILASIPKERGRRFAPEEEVIFKLAAEEQDKYEGGTQSIQSNLKGWEKDIFDALNEIDSDVFKLKDVYEFAERLSQLHPENKFVKAKIRQQLQQLRDLGLVEFLERGVYRKLWR